MSDVIAEGSGDYKVYWMTETQVGLKLNGQYFSFYCKDGEIRLLSQVSEGSPKGDSKDG